jgi:hypothetical protein
MQHNQCYWKKNAEIYLPENTTQKTLLDYVEPLQMGEPTIDTSGSPYLESGNRFYSDIVPRHPRISIIEDRLSGTWNKLQGRYIWPQS